MNLRKKTETSSDITLEWDPVPGVIGYRFSSATTAKWSHTFDPNRRDVKFSKAAWYKVEALGVEDVGQYPSAPPPAGVLPSTITRGGTYAGTREGTVAVRTAEPVLLDSFRIERDDAETLLDCDYPGARVTCRRGVFQGGQGMAIYSQGFDLLDVQNCDINFTWGIRPGTGRTGFTLRVNRNRFRNQVYVPGVSPYNVSHPFQAVGCASNPTLAEVAWNEFLQDFGISQTEDIISIYESHRFKVHDNYLRGAYPATHGDRYSGGGVLVDSGSQADYNEIYDNVCIQTQNYTFAIAGGNHNRLYRNRGFCNSRDESGVAFTNLASGGNGMVITYGSDHRAYENVLGILQPDGGRNDWYTPAAVNDIAAENVRYGGTIGPALFQAELVRWQQRVSANGITVGA